MNVVRHYPLFIIVKVVWREGKALGSEDGEATGSNLWLGSRGKKLGRIFSKSAKTALEACWCNLKSEYQLGICFADTWLRKITQDLESDLPVIGP
jgi:hypothetical protein